MSNRVGYTFSMDAPECQVCCQYNECKNKRRVACSYREPLINSVAAEITQPIVADIAAKHDYRDIKIGENTTVTIDLEEIKKKINEDFYKALRCPWLQGGA